MKHIRYITISLSMLCCLWSCSLDNWLDVNVNPNSPTDVVAAYQNRLPSVQHYLGYALFGTAGVRSGYATGIFTAHASATGANSYGPAWNPNNGMTTIPYQSWYVGGGVNIPDMIAKAEEAGAYHYVGAGLTLHALGFMMMTDWYGETPYEEAFTENFSPKHDDGKTIFYGCLENLDKAIAYFEMTQSSTAAPLKDGDSWNGGDVDKWKALAYGLKARWLNNLSKKSTYDPEAILAALEKAPKDISTSSIIKHMNDPADLIPDNLGYGDPLWTNFLFNVASWSDHVRLTKWYTDKFEYQKADGTPYYDPRREKMLPMNQHYNEEGKPYFMVTEGVDVLTTNIRLASGPSQGSYNSDEKVYSVASTAAERQRDTVYVTLRSICAKHNYANYVPYDGTYYAADGTILSTGTYYTLPESPTDVCTYAEMKFIEAEVYFRLNDKAKAWVAYKAGVQAHMDMMQAHLRSYAYTGPNKSKMPMDDADIAEFMQSDALCQDAALLTMAEIMKQKYIALSYTQQNWNDMRRFNYSAGNIADFGVVYPDYDRPYEMTQDSKTNLFPGATKNDDNYWWRRMEHCSHEVRYNSAQMLERNPRASDLDIWSIPVWWDTAED